MPAVALAAEYAQGLGHLGPGDRVGDVLDAIGQPVVASVAAQAGDELHVLPHRCVLVAAGGDRRLAAEEPERARDDEVAPQAIPPQAPGQEGALILDGLDPGDDPPRSASGHDPSLADHRPVDRPDRAARGHDAVVQQERAHHAQQRLGLDDGVGVDGARELARGDVEARVQRVGLAAVVLVDHDEAGARGRPVDRADRRRADAATVDAVDLDEVEVATQDVDRVVAGAVVDEDDLELRVGQRQQRAHALADGERLVECGGEHGDPGRRLRAEKS